jgi:peptide/nickel transport system substrate-binding protein
MKKALLILTAVVLLFSLMLSACAEPEEPTPEPEEPAPAPEEPAPAPEEPAPAPEEPAPAPEEAAPKPEEPAPEPEPDNYGGILKEVLTVGPATPIGYPPEAAPDAQADARPAVESLVQVKNGGVVEPLLATAWEIAPDGKSVTLTLRQGVKFHDGTEFNAAAVKWNLDREIEAEKATDWESVDVIDDYTVRINIPGYKNTILTGLGSGTAMIISPAAVEENGLDWARWHPVGTGPFKFVEYERDAKLVYERNDDYWQEGLPYLDGIEFVVIADETVRSIAFQKGDIHTLRASGLTAQELRDKGFDYVTRAGGTYLLIPDSGNPDSPFADKNVRLAVSHAIDREALAEALGYGFSSPAYQIFPGFIETAIPDLDKHEFDQDLARQLLDEAGYPDGFNTTIHAFIRVVPKDYVTAIANMLGEVGIIVEPDFPEAGKYSEYRFGGWSDAMMAHALGSFENMNSAFTFYFGGIQFPSVQKPDGWQETYDAALSSETVDPVKTQALVKLMHDDVMVIPYMEETAVAFIQKGVHDSGHLKDSLTTLTDFEITWLDPELR